MTKPNYLAAHKALQGTFLASLSLLPSERGAAIVLIRAHLLAAESRPMHADSRFRARRYAQALVALAAR